MKNHFLWAGFAFIVLSGCSQPASNSQQTKAVTNKKPNVVLIVADDLGYTDLGAFGSEIHTPNLDALAYAGTRFTQFYTAPICSPTRAMLMTGADNHQVGLGSMAEALTPNQRGKVGYEGYLNERATFLPKVFADNGYNTMMTGKWHLGLEDSQSPHARGFEQTYVLLEGGASHFNDRGIDKPKATYRQNGELIDYPNGEYSSQVYADKMIEFMRNKQDSDKPFFAYLAFTAPHWPLQAPRESIEKYSGKYASGFDMLAQQRVNEAQQKGVILNATKPGERGHGLTDWASLSDDDKAISQRKMEVYAGMVDHMDSQLGKVIDYLKSTGEFDNTVIFFMSDNGAEKADLDYGTGKRFAEFANRCCDNSPAGIGSGDSYVFYGPSWARASVGIARDAKGAVYDGGIHAPAFMLVPNGMSHISHQFFTVKDVLPTLMDIAGVAVPTGAEVRVEGTSLFSGNTESQIMGWEFIPGKGLRQGDWKLVGPSVGPLAGQWQLFNLRTDPGERQDVKAKFPEVFSNMRALWDQYEQDKGLVFADLKRSGLH